MPERVTCTEADMDRVRDNAQPVFDLRKGPMFRAVVYQTEKSVYLHLMADHMILDGDSMDILTEDMDLALRGEAVPPERMSFPALNAEQALPSPSAEQGRRWFRGLLAGSPACGLKPGAPDPEGQNMAYLALTPTEAELERLCAGMRVSLTALLCGTLGMAIAAEDGTGDVVFEISFNGRSDSRLSRTVGYLVQSVPVRCRVEKEQPFAEWLRALQEQLLRSMGCAAEATECVRELAPDCAGHLVISQRPEPETVPMGGKPAECVDLSGKKAGTPAGLSTLFTLTPLSWGLALAALFDPERYSAERVRAVQERLNRIMINAAPGKTLGELMETN